MEFIVGGIVSRMELFSIGIVRVVFFTFFELPLPLYRFLSGLALTLVADFAFILMYYISLFDKKPSLKSDDLNAFHCHNMY